MSRWPRVICLSLLIAPAAMAQPAPGGAGGGVQTELPGQQRPTLTGAEMLSQGREYRAGIDKTIAQVQKMVDEARKQKDVIRLNCVTDKLVQCKVDADLIDQALRALGESVAHRDDGAMLHEYARITIIHQKVQVLQSDAQGCVGEELSYIGQTSVQVDAPNLPSGVTDPPMDPPPLDRPPPATPYE